VGIHPVTCSALLRHSNSHPCARKHSPQDFDTPTPKTDYDYIVPIVDPTSLDLRCGRNAWRSGAWDDVKTATVYAGDTVGFAVNTTVGLPIEGTDIMPWDVVFTSS
jgi:hypothetical protein